MSAVHDHADFIAAQHTAGRPARVAKRFDIALGVERSRLVPLHAPALSILVVLLAVAAAFGVQRMKVDDFVSQLFRSNTPEFAQFEQLSRQFPSSEYDVVAVVEGKSLLARDSIEDLRGLVTDLQLVEGARGVTSLFSARQLSQTGVPQLLFPRVLPHGPEYEKLVRRAISNDLVRGKLVSNDGTLALVVLSLDPKVVEGPQLQTIVDDIRRTVNEDLQGDGLRLQLSGAPVRQLENRKALERDRLVYNAIGFLVGCAIAILFFRRVSLMIVAARPPSPPREGAEAEAEAKVGLSRQGLTGA